MIKKIIQNITLILIVFFSPIGFAEELEIFPSPLEAAIADTVSSVIAINGGAKELNPLGLTAVTVLKIGLVFIVNEKLEGDDKYLVEKAESSIWTGATFNNLFVILNASPVTAVIAGVFSGLIVWNTN